MKLSTVNYKDNKDQFKIVLLNINIHFFNPKNEITTILIINNKLVRQN